MSSTQPVGLNGNPGGLRRKRTRSAALSPSKKAVEANTKITSFFERSPKKTSLARASQQSSPCPVAVTPMESVGESPGAAIPSIESPGGTEEEDYAQITSNASPISLLRRAGKGSSTFPSDPFLTQEDDKGSRRFETPSREGYKTPKERQRLKQREKEQSIQDAMDYLQNQFVSPAYSTSPTKRILIAEELPESAKRLAEMRRTGTTCKDLFVFSIRHHLRSNHYEVDMSSKNGSESRWLLFMANKEMRQWFFADDVTDTMDPRLYPPYNDICAKWIRSEIAVENDSWMREKYSKIWNRILRNDIDQGRISEDRLRALAIAMMKDVGANDKLFDQPGGYGDFVQDVIPEQFTRSGARSHDLLSIPSQGHIESMLRIITDSYCYFLKKHFSLKAFYFALTLILVCSADCLLSINGSLEPARAVAALVSSVPDEVWESKAFVMALSLSLEFSDDTLRRRLLDMLASVQTINKSIRIMHWRQALALACLLGTTDKWSKNLTAEEVITTLILPFAEKNWTFSTKAQVIAQKDKLRFQFTFALHAVACNLEKLTEREISGKSADNKAEGRRALLLKLDNAQVRMGIPDGSDASHSGLHESLHALTLFLTELLDFERLS